MGGRACAPRSGRGRRSRRAPPRRPTASPRRVQPDGSILASGPNPELTTYTVDVRDAGAGRHRRCASRRCPIPSLPRGGPGRDAYGHFRVTGLARDDRAARPAAPRRRCRSRRSRSTTRRIRVRAERLLAEPPRRRPAASAGSWAINAMRESTRLPRHAVLKAAQPFGFPGGTRFTLRIEHAGRHDRPGHRPLPAVGATTAADPLIGADGAGALRPDARAGRPAPRRKADAARPGRAVPPGRRPASSRARDALKAARKALVDLQIPTHAGDAGPRRLRAAVLRAARARRLHVARRADVRADAGGAAADEGLAAGQPPRPGPLARRSRQPAVGARPGQPPVGAAVRPRPGRDQRGLRHAGAAAVAPGAARLARRRARWIAAGARRRCCATIVTSATYRQASTVVGRRWPSAIPTTGCSRAVRASASRPR